MRQPSRPGRNSPCHCGSGLKFKRCHGRPEAEPTRVAAPGAKTSERLLALAKPLLDEADIDDDEFVTRLKVAMAAWNLAVLDATAGDTGEIRAYLREMGVEREVAALAVRKEQLFPDDMRQLLDVVVTRQPCGELYVQVISAC